MMFIHPTAEVEDETEIGEGTRIWHLCHIRRGARIGTECNLARGVFVDCDVRIGDRVKVQNYVSIYHGVTVEAGVFIGPHVCFTNDLNPRAVAPDGAVLGASGWSVSETLVQEGASIGANSTIRCGVSLGRWCMVGAGSVVTKSVVDFGLVLGNPARLVGYVCRSGNRHETLSSAESCAGCDKERSA